MENKETERGVKQFFLMALAHNQTSLSAAKLHFLFYICAVMIKKDEL
jgi:hypothetical protein